LVTCGLPYANGPCHIAHLRTYVPGDVFVRYLRKLGQEVVFVCGSDTHGTPITVNAEALGITPKELVARYHEHFQEVFKKLNIFFDNYGSTDDPRNHLRTRQIVEALMGNGYIYPKEVEQPYCPSCERFLPDRYVRGTCPHCGEDARGDECDQGCGRPLEPGDLLDPRCAICGTPAETRKTRQFFLRLTAFEGFLKDYLPKLEGTSIARNYSLQWVEKGLIDWCITRNLEWGVKFPGQEGLVLYVWVDAPIGYISSTEEWSEKEEGDWETFWKGRGRLVHFIGGDIVYHHCIFWPAMLQGSGYNVPWAVVASGMVRVEGKIFSKSRGYVIWVEEDYLDRGLDPDALRYYILSYTGHTRDLDFSWSAYQEKVNKELVGTLGNFLYRALLFAYRNFKRVPEGSVDAEVRGVIEETLEAILSGLDEYEFKKIADAILNLSAFGNRYFQSHAPWKTLEEDREACSETIYNCLWIARALGVLLSPLLPGKAQELWEQLGEDGRVDETPVTEALQPPAAGKPIGRPTPLFQRVSEEEISSLVEMVKDRISKAQG
ncbi:MAG: methionine--tRNA ligase, partial [Candidatus Bathyarchaeia archaeon]